MTVYDLIPSRRTPPLKGFKRWYHILLCSGMIVAMGWFEYLTRPQVLFPFACLVPTGLLVRYGSWRWGALLAGMEVTLRIGLAWQGGFYYGPAFHTLNIVTLIASLSIVIWFMNELHRQNTTIEILRGLLPICAHCKSIRDANGEWHSVEDYMAQHAEARFTHGICPHCQKKHFPDD